MLDSGEKRQVIKYIQPYDGVRIAACTGSWEQEGRSAKPTALLSLETLPSASHLFFNNPSIPSTKDSLISSGEIKHLKRLSVEEPESLETSSSLLLFSFSRYAL